MSAPRIALIVDHPQRDLAGALLTAIELCQRGARCYLVPLNLQDTEVMALTPDCVFLNYMRVSNYRLAQKLEAAGIQFGTLDTEGGVWADFRSYTELLWPDTDLLKRAGFVCMWGPRLADHCVQEGLYPPERTFVTGCPRFDFYRPEWHGVLAEDRLPGTPAGRRRKTILFNTNFSVINPRFTTPEQSKDYCRREYGWPVEEIERVTSTETAAIRATIELVRRLAADFPAAAVVVRPHPFENPEPYRRALGGLRNLTVNPDGPVQPRICAAAVVIQRSCTTAIEAAAASVPTLSPQWIPAPYLMPMSEAVSVPCQDYGEMRNRVEAIFRGEYEPEAPLRKAIDQTIHDWFYRVDGQCHQRVSSVVLEHLESGGHIDRRRCIQYLYGLNGEAQPLGERLSRRLRYTLSLSPDWSFLKMKAVPNLVWTATSKHLDLGEARRLTIRIEQVRRASGGECRPVAVDLARELGHCRRGYHGHSLSLSCKS